MSVYHRQEGAEDLETYRPGGFHPVEIGDKFNDGRYQVVHKLGYGAFSTVWIAWDHQHDRLVSLKVLTADGSRWSLEAYILQHLHPQPCWFNRIIGKYLWNIEHPGQAFVLGMLNEFQIHGPNGSHWCIVTDVLGPNVPDARATFDDYRLPLHISRKLAMQLALGLAYIHSRGVIHADLHMGNVLLCIPDLDSWTIDDVYTRFGEPVKRPIIRIDEKPPTPAAPRYTVLPIRHTNLLELCLTNNCALKIADFGQSFLSTDKYNQHMARHIRMPLPIVAPEVLFEAEQSHNFGMEIDIWALACTLYGILGSGLLFEIWIGSSDELLLEWVKTLGKFPDQWWRKWKARGEFFEEDGTFKRNTAAMVDLEHIPLKMRLENMRCGERGEPVEDAFEPEELDALEVVLERILKHLPEDRIGAEEVVRLLPAAWERGEAA